MPKQTSTSPAPTDRDSYQSSPGPAHVQQVDFSPVDGADEKPWDPTWYLYSCARSRFVEASQSCLELCCGEGVGSLLLGRLGYRVEGIDLSATDLTTAEHLALRYRLDQSCRFKKMAAEQLGFSDGMFDLVVGLDMLPLVDIEKMINEVHRVLKVGGTALFKCHVASPDRRGGESASGGLRAKALVHGVTELQAEHAQRTLDGEDLRHIHNRFEHVEIKRFTIANRLGRLLATRAHFNAAHLQQTENDLADLCPPLARLGESTVIICHKTK